jgi:hypothetical protein
MWSASRRSNHAANIANSLKGESDMSTKKWRKTKPVRWADISRAALILGLYEEDENDPQRSMGVLQPLIDEQIARGRAEKLGKGLYAARDVTVLHTTPAGNQLIFHPRGSGAFRQD